VSESLELQLRQRRRWSVLTHRENLDRDHATRLVEVQHDSRLDLVGFGDRGFFVPRLLGK